MNSAFPIKMNKLIPVEIFEGPCLYDGFPESLGDYYSGKTTSDILMDTNIDADTKLWFFTRQGVMDSKTLRLFFCAFVRKFKHNKKGAYYTSWDVLTDERSKNAVIVAEKHANGEASDIALERASDGAYSALTSSENHSKWSTLSEHRAARDACACTTLENISTTGYTRGSGWDGEWDNKRSDEKYCNNEWPDYAKRYWEIALEIILKQ